MTTVIVEPEPGNEPAPVEIEPPTEALEAVADSAVEIAQIEADANVATAEIQAAVAITAIEANAEHERERAQWRADLTSLQEQLSTSQTTIAELQAQLAPPTPPLEPEVSAEPLTDQEAETIASSIQSDTSQSTNSILTVPIVENETEEVVLQPPIELRRKPARDIRLV